MTTITRETLIGPIPFALMMEVARGHVRMGGPAARNRFGGSGSGFAYSPTKDVISLPFPKGGDPQFFSGALHELAHWTGHESRLNRPALYKGATCKFSYAYEEIVAEGCAVILMGKTGMATAETRKASVDYIASFMESFPDFATAEEVKTVITGACALAVKAALYITERTRP